jgi:tetratricopeptide (TPR) repeat protein
VNITYSKKKQELRRDPVMDSIGRGYEFLKKNSSTITGALVVALFVLISVSVYRSIRESSMLKAEEAFGRAMTAFAAGEQSKAIELFTIVADNHEHTPHAAYSAYMLGSISLSYERYDEAITWLEVARARQKGAGFVGAAALEGLLTAFEGKGDLAKAAEYGRKALAEESIAYRYPAIRWKMALLSRQLGRLDEVRGYCDQIVADSLALDFRQKAENLLVELQIQGKS